MLAPKKTCSRCSLKSSWQFPAVWCHRVRRNVLFSHWLSACHVTKPSAILSDQHETSATGRDKDLSAKDAFSSKWRRNADQEGGDLSFASVRYVGAPLNAAETTQNYPDLSGMWDNVTFCYDSHLTSWVKNKSARCCTSHSHVSISLLAGVLSRSYSQLQVSCTARLFFGIFHSTCCRSSKQDLCQTKQKQRKVMRMRLTSR